MPDLPNIHRPRQTAHIGERERAKRNQSKRCYATSDTTWRKLRARILTANPLCRECLKQGQITPANTVDHWDGDTYNNRPDNLIPMCTPCHSRKTVKVDGGFGNRKGGTEAWTAYPTTPRAQRPEISPLNRS